MKIFRFKNLSFVLLVFSFAGFSACINFSSEANEGGSEGGSTRSSHSPGTDCNRSGCHSGNIESDKRWTIAGTVYDSATGVTGVSGETVTITDANSKVVNLTTDGGGNFYTTTGVTFPVKASLGNGRAMVATISNGSCNNCHFDPTLIY